MSSSIRKGEFSSTVIRNFFGQFYIFFERAAFRFRAGWKCRICCTKSNSTAFQTCPGGSGFARNWRKGSEKERQAPFVKSVFVRNSLLKNVPFRTLVRGGTMRRDSLFRSAAGSGRGRRKARSRRRHQWQWSDVVRCASSTIRSLLFRRASRLESQSVTKN